MSLLIVDLPLRLVFGKESTNLLVDECRLYDKLNLFVLTIPSLVSKVQSLLSPLEEDGFKLHFDYSINNEPTFSDFHRLLQAAEDFNANGVIGIGGGSVMDVAKLIAALLNSKQSLDEIIGNNRLKGRNTWLACVPTTSGTGSEVSPNSILIDDINKGGKVGIISRYLVPDASFIDPLYTVGVPADVTGATGLDALTHCIEAFVNRFSHPVIDLYALEGIRLIAGALERAVNCGTDLDARSDLSLGSMYGGMCLGPVNTAAVHALSYPLGSKYGIPHGLANAILLPSVMRFNIPEVPKLYAKIAEALGVVEDLNDFEKAYKGVEFIESLLKACRIEANLKSMNIQADDIAILAKEGMQVQRLLKNNPRLVNFEDALLIYKSLL